MRPGRYKQRAGTLTNYHFVRATCTTIQCVCQPQCFSGGSCAEQRQLLTALTGTHRAIHPLGLCGLQPCYLLVGGVNLTKLPTVHNQPARTIIMMAINATTITCSFPELVSTLTLYDPGNMLSICCYVKHRPLEVPHRSRNTRPYGISTNKICISEKQVGFRRCNSSETCSLAPEISR